MGDRLYLNYNLDIRQQWSKDVAGHVAKADENWPAVQNLTEVYR